MSASPSPDPDEDDPSTDADDPHVVDPHQSLIVDKARQRRRKRANHLDTLRGKPTQPAAAARRGGVGARSGGRGGGAETEELGGDGGDEDGGDDDDDDDATRRNVPVKSRNRAAAAREATPERVRAFVQRPFIIFNTSDPERTRNKQAIPFLFCFHVWMSRPVPPCLSCRACAFPASRWRTAGTARGLRASPRDRARPLSSPHARSSLSRVSRHHVCVS